MATRVAVIGAGSWGTVVAAMLARRVGTALWARRPELAAAMRSSHRNPRYLGDHPLPDGMSVTSSLAEALAGADAVVMAVPSHGFRRVLADAAPWVAPGVPVVSLTKGLEEGSLQRMTEVVAAVLPGHPAGVLTGPNLAAEVLAGYPAASVIAFADGGVATDLQGLFVTDSFRVYTNPDVVGCELAGALKNVTAIASGMVDGLGFGDNTRAALLTRGLAELTRLGVAMGGHPMTFAGLAGMGDLVATCTSRHSRNRYVGEQLGAGRTIADIEAEMEMVAEGVKTSKPVVDLAGAFGVDMPIAAQVAAVLHHGKRAADAIPSLMQRQAKPEIYGLSG